MHLHNKDHWCLSLFCGDEWVFFCQLVLKIGIDEKTFNEFLYFLELFTTVFCVGNYKGHTKAVWTSTMVLQMLGIDFGWYGFYRVSTGKIFLLELQMKFASIYWISSVFDA